MNNYFGVLEKMVVKRLPAIKTRIYDIVNGKFYPGSKENLNPSYIITPFGEKISRVNSVATVVEKFMSSDGNYASVTLDDSSETVRAKVFKDSVGLFSGIEKGDMILIVGKVKEYNGEIYINSEVASKIKNPNEENLRKLEILQKLIRQKILAEEIRNLAENVSEEEVLTYAKEKYNLDRESVQYIIQSKKQEVDYKPKVLEIIKNLDKDDGVEVGKLFEILDLPENIIERTINDLLSSGELFEPSLGRLRRVG